MTGEEIKRKRLQLKMTQEGLAKQLEIAHNTLYRWESGRYKPNRLYEKHLRAFFEKEAKRRNITYT